jgi:hypothetical protein
MSRTNDAWTVAVLAVALWAGAAAAQDPDLILYYDYEEILGGKIKDRSGKGHDGLINGNISLEAGKYGKSARFERGSFLDLDGPNWPAKDIPRDGMSVVAWVNVDSLADHHAIFNARAGDSTWLVHPEVRTEGNYRWLLRSDGGSTIFDMRAGSVKQKTWVHFAGVYDSGEGMARLYIDGKEVGSNPGKARVAKDWGMGARVGYNIDNARPFTGLMDDLNLWKRGLRAGEVATIMEFGPLPQAVSPAGRLASTWAGLKRR